MHILVFDNLFLSMTFPHNLNFQIRLVDSPSLVVKVDEELIVGQLHGDDEGGWGEGHQKHLDERRQLEEDGDPQTAQHAAQEDVRRELARQVVVAADGGRVRQELEELTSRAAQL